MRNRASPHQPPAGKELLHNGMKDLRIPPESMMPVTDAD